MSSYQNKSLKEFTERNGWHKQEFKMALSMTHGYGNPRKKVEVLTANYPISVKVDERSKKQLVGGKEEAGD